VAGDRPCERHGFVTGGTRIRHGSAPSRGGSPAPERSGICRDPYPPVRRLSHSAGVAVFLTWPYAKFRTPQGSPWFEMVVWRPFRTTQGSAWLEIRVWRGFPTRQIPDRSDPPLSRAEGSRKSDFVPSLCRLPNGPSRPGRLIAVTASQTAMRRPGRPRTAGAAGRAGNYATLLWLRSAARRRGRGSGSRCTGAVERAWTRRSLQVRPSRTSAGRPSATAVAISTPCRITP